MGFLDDNLPEGSAHDPRAPWNMPPMPEEPTMCRLCLEDEAVATALVDGKRVAICKVCVTSEDFEGTDVQAYD